MKRLAKRLDPHAPRHRGDERRLAARPLSGVVDVQGFNYNEPAHRRLSQATFRTSRWSARRPASTVSTRGIYANDKAKGYVSAYDLNFPPWAATAERWWTFYAERPFLAGGFVWTGFDYRGEPTPYGWPCINSHFGILDTCGFPKDNFYYYQAWWGSKPVLHLFPHWNWSGKRARRSRSGATPTWSAWSCSSTAAAWARRMW